MLKSTSRPLLPDTTGCEVRASALSLIEQGQARLRQALDGCEQDWEEVVHQTRVDMKRLRALWYLAQPGLSGKGAVRLHDSSRELARQLGGSRDRQVMHATLLIYAGALPDDVSRRLLAGLQSTAAVGVEASLLEQADAAYRQLERLLNEVPFSGVRRRHIRHALDVSFGKGQLWYRHAGENDGNSEALHRWRKWSKVLLYQLEWLGLSPDWGAVLKPLGSGLGDIHDLDVLVSWLHEFDIRSADQVLLESLLAADRQQRVRQVLRQGRVVYAINHSRRRSRRLYRRWLKVD